MANQGLWKKSVVIIGVVLLGEGKEEEVIDTVCLCYCILSWQYMILRGEGGKVLSLWFSLSTQPPLMISSKHFKIE